MKTMMMVVLAALLGAGAEAALFDTRQQIEMKYGAPSRQQGETLVYKKDGFDISVDYLSGRAHRLCYMRGDRFSDYQIESVLNANRGGVATWKWRKRNPTHWTLVGGSAEAILRMRELEIVSDDWKRIGRNAGGVEASLRPGSPTGPNAPAAPVGGEGRDVISISAKTARGYTVGALAAGTVIRLQYMEGKWKSWGNIATACPDSAQDIGGDGKGGERNRLVITNVRPGGAEQVLAVVPPGTAGKPFEFVAPSDFEDVVLRINDADGNYGTNPDAGVKYRLTVGRSAARTTGLAVAASGKVKYGNKVVDRASVVIEPVQGTVTRFEGKQKWPFYVNHYSGTWVKTLKGETVILIACDHAGAQMPGASLNLEAVPLGKMFEGARVFQEAVPVKE